jgi:hypothetical protein
MAEIEDEITLTFQANNLRFNTALEKSTIIIEDVQLDEDQAATLAYLINNDRNFLEAQIKLTGRAPLPEY